MQIQDQKALNEWLMQHAQKCADWLGAGQFAQGSAALRPLLQQHPGWGLGWKLQAAFLTSMAQHEDAFQAVSRAAQLLPEDAELFNIAATLFRDTGQLDKSISCFIKASELNPTMPEVYNNLGGAFMLKGEVDHAISAFGRALELFEDYPEALQNMGSALLVKGRPAEASGFHLRAVELQPARQQALSMACQAMLQSADWGRLGRAIAQLQTCLGRPGYQAPIPFVFNGLPGSSRQQHLQCAQQFAQEQYAGFMSRPAYCSHAMSTQGPLRIGYMSADFHEHATAYLLAGVLECHDRSQVEIYAYSYGPAQHDPMRQRLETACDVFRDIQACSHEESARTIAGDRIDILVDLKGFTENARPQIVALRPAPVIVSWLGYPSTMGQRRLADYLIGDPVVTPLAHQVDYSETLALMPHSYQPTDAARRVGRRPARTSEGLPADGFVFCSFNQIYKITPQVFDGWCSIVLAVPGSVLWLLEGAPHAMDNLRREAGARGLTEQRLVFARKLPQAEHLERLRLADLALDTFPYTSHTTGSDALWACVPLVTRMGETFGSRVAASLLHAAALPDLVAADEASYGKLAIGLARDEDRRARIRQHLEVGRVSLPLFDTYRFTRHLESLFSTIREQQLAGSVRAFVVPENS
jgi:predicted O-linked N-acetylglucosamine transferase (SPINDLY family)